jgi:predicted ATPase/DNA-binding SARP family transcriptional activator
MDRIEISLLGPLQVAVNGRTVTDFRTESERAVLVYLAMHSDTACRRDALAALLWPDRPDAAAFRNLRVTLSRLRTTIHDREVNPPFLQTTHRIVQLNPEADHWLDVTAFSERIAAVEQHGHTRLETCSACIRRLQEAVELCRGDFVTGLYASSPLYEEWVVIQREALHRQALDALGKLTEYYEGRAEYDLSLEHARRQVELEPWREAAHRQWMRALALSGQRCAAMAQYDTCREILMEELGVEPEGETTELYERIRDDAELLPMPPAASHNLPTLLTPFVGRAALLAEIEERLEDPSCRLLTLVGLGGTGKTRLAIESAKYLLNDGARERYPDGVFYISLAPLQSASTIVPTIARTLDVGFYGEEEPRDQLLSYLQPKAMLLILDNFEHLLQGATLVTEILRTAPNLKILVTSRAPLSVDGEYRLRIEGMAYPERESRDGALEYSAVELFVQSAARAHPGVEWTAGDLESVVRICRQVKGVPLAIVLAAAWVEMLSPAEIAAEIGRSLDFLKSNRRDLPDRQRSTRAVFEHTWHLLTERERRVLRELSAFRGGFSREAVEWVTGASLRDLTALVNRSLLHRTPHQWFEIHELVRQYAAEQLCLASTVGETERDELEDVVPERECVIVPGRYCVAAGDRHCYAVRDRHSAFYAEYLHQRESDVFKGRVQETMREIDNIRAAWDWAVRHGKAEEILKSAMSLWLVYNSMSLLHEGAATFGRAAESLQRETASESTETRELALGLALGIQGFFLRYVGGAGRSAVLVQEGISTLRRYGARRELALCKWIACTNFPEDDPDRQRLLRESLAISRETGFHLGTVLALRGLGRNETALEISREADDLRGMAFALEYLGDSAYAREQLPRARKLYEQALSLFQQVGIQRHIGTCFLRLGDVALAQGKHEAAKIRYREALAQFQRIHYDLGIVRALAGLGNVALSLDDHGIAAGHYRQALEIAVKTRFGLFSTEIKLDLVAGIAALLAHTDEDRAVELAALSRHHPSSTEQTKDRAQTLLDSLRASAPAVTFTAAEARGQSRDVRTTVRELREALDVKR